MGADLRDHWSIQTWENKPGELFSNIKYQTRFKRGGLKIIIPELVLVASSLSNELESIFDRKVFIFP